MTTNLGSRCLLVSTDSDSGQISVIQMVPAGTGVSSKWLENTVPIARFIHLYDDSRDSQNDNLNKQVDKVQSNFVRRSDNTPATDLHGEWWSSVLDLLVISHNSDQSDTGGGPTVLDKWPRHPVSPSVRDVGLSIVTFDDWGVLRRCNSFLCFMAKVMQIWLDAPQFHAYTY